MKKGKTLTNKNNRKYYEAYDDRYKQVHKNFLQWASDENSEPVIEIMEKYNIDTKMQILEIGCGEGRDAIYLLKKGYNVYATDISPTAVDYCKKIYPQKPEAFGVLNCLTDGIDNKFDFIYAVAIVHMLVLDEDRNKFYKFIFNQLNENGVALICTMGDGQEEKATNINIAFELREKTHQSGAKLNIAETSCRIVNMNYFLHEIKDNNLEIVESGTTTSVPGFTTMLFAVVKKVKISDIKK